MNQKIKETCLIFVKFFENERNQIFTFQVYSYLYRDRSYDEVMDDLSIFVSTMLRKITAYKTFVFIKFFEENLEEKIKTNLDKSSEVNRAILVSKNPEEDYELSQKHNKKAKQMINFVKSKLTKKKTD